MESFCCLVSAVSVHRSGSGCESLGGAEEVSSSRASALLDTVLCCAVTRSMQVWTTYRTQREGQWKVML